MTLPGLTRKSIEYQVSTNTHLQLDHDTTFLECYTRKPLVVEGKMGMESFGETDWKNKMKWFGKDFL